MPKPEPKRGDTSRGNRDSSDAGLTLERLFRQLKDRKEDFRQLAGLTTPATVMFLDLVGSTGYRISHGADKALDKAYTHNVVVGESVRLQGGYVVKWLGDGVMALFLDDNNLGRALLAGSDAVRDLQTHNKSLLLGWEHAIHTKIGVSTGEVHLLTVNNAPLPNRAESHGQEITFNDPIGIPADLAARLCSLAEANTILIDKQSFVQICSPQLAQIN